MTNSSVLTRNEALELAKQVANTVASALGNRQIQLNRPAHIVAATTAVTICDGLAAVIALIQSYGQGHAATIVRGMIESLLDLTLICADPKNVARLTLASQRGTKRYLELAASVEGGPAAAERDIIRHLLRDTVEHIESLKSKGVTEIEIEEKFRMARDYAVLKFWYRRFIAHAHNNFDAIFSRHMKGTEIKLGETLTDSEVLELLAIASSVTAEVLSFLPQFANISEAEAATLRTQLRDPLTSLASGCKASSQI